MSTSSSIPGFPFKSHYATIDENKVCITLMRAKGPPILMFHGEPTWNSVWVPWVRSTQPLSMGKRGGRICGWTGRE